MHHSNESKLTVLEPDPSFSFAFPAKSTTLSANSKTALAFSVLVIVLLVPRPPLLLLPLWPGFCLGSSYIENSANLEMRFKE